MRISLMLDYGIIQQLRAIAELEESQPEAIAESILLANLSKRPELEDLVKRRDKAKKQVTEQWAADWCETLKERDAAMQQLKSLT